MNSEATNRSWDELVVVEESVTSYVVRPEALLRSAPRDRPAGAYVARLDSGGEGSPSFVLLPYTQGEAADVVVLAEAGQTTSESPRYVRVATRAGAADYRLHATSESTGWVPPLESQPR